MAQDRCVICRRPIESLVPTIEWVGGFFDDDGFFSIDQDVAPEAHAHAKCLEDVIKAGFQRGQGDQRG